MNTPAHAIVNLLLLPGQRARATVPIILGALIPDAPIVLFYAWAKLMQGLPEKAIWTSAYHGSGWQALIDAFHSLPILALACLICWRMKLSIFTAFFASMFLHSCFDFPLHHDDAHRHFWPLSDWQFHSPISYWNPSYFGDIVGPIEFLMVIAGGAWLLRKAEATRHRRWIGGVLMIYVAYWGFAAAVWM